MDEVRSFAPFFLLLLLTLACMTKGASRSEPLAVFFSLSKVG